MMHIPIRILQHAVKYVSALTLLLHVFKFLEFKILLAIIQSLEVM